MKKTIYARMKPKVFFLLLLVIVSSVIFTLPAKSDEGKDNFTIGLAVLKDNDDYHAGRTAFVEVLEKQEDMDVEFRLLDAFGDSDAYKRGLEYFAESGEIDLLFTTGTMSTLPAVKIIKNIPVVFTAVAAPLRSGIVDNLDKPGGNVTGTQCTVPAYSQIKAIMKVIPYVKRIGLVYTSGESNAEIQTRDFIDAGKELGIEVLTSTVSKDCKTEEEVAEAARKLIGKVDVLAAHQDTSLSRYGEGMINVAKENNIPTYASLKQLLSKGAVCSLGINFKSLGDISGQQALMILKENKPAGDIPVQSDRNYSLAINLTAAKEVDLRIPVQVLRSASEIIK